MQLIGGCGSGPRPPRIR